MSNDSIDCHSLKYCLCCRDKQLSARLPIHCFVNDMDVVPRLLESNQVTSLLPVVQQMLLFMKASQSIVKKASSAGSFVSIGTVYLLLSDSVKVFDSQFEKTGLQQTIQKIYQCLSGQSSPDSMSFRLLQDHQLEKYADKLQTAVSHLVPILFAGGVEEDYEAVNVRRLSSSAGGQFATCPAWYRRLCLKQMSCEVSTGQHGMCATLHDTLFHQTGRNMLSC